MAGSSLTGKTFLRIDYLCVLVELKSLMECMCVTRATLKHAVTQSIYLLELQRKTQKMQLEKDGTQNNLVQKMGFQFLMKHQCQKSKDCLEQLHKQRLHPCTG